MFGPGGQGRLLLEGIGPNPEDREELARGRWVSKGEAKQAEGAEWTKAGGE